jgi:hypothetical protein
MRFTCDHGGCGRHFDADAVLGASTTGELMDDVGSPPLLDGEKREAVRLDSVIVLPSGWRAYQKAERWVPFVYCREHAEDAG